MKHFDTSTPANEPADLAVFPPSLVSHDDLATFLAEPVEDAALSTIVGIQLASTWTLSLTESGTGALARREYFGHGPLALEKQAGPAQDRIQLLDRRALVEWLTVAVLSTSCAEPTERCTSVRTSPLALELLGQDDRTHSLDLAIAISDADLPAEFIDAVCHTERLHTLTRMSPTTDLRYEKLVFVSAGEHGRWAVWLQLSATSTDLTGPVKVRRVDERWAHKLIKGFAGDLVSQASDLTLDDELA